MLSAIGSDSEHFPPHVRRNGRAYFEQRRVGPLEYDEKKISAAVRGTRTYKTAWSWNGDAAEPRCTCLSAPVCKHAYALAAAIGAALSERASGPANTARVRAREARDAERQSQPFRGDVFRREERLGERASAELAKDLAHWARRHAETPTRSLRAVFGLETSEGDRPAIWIEVRATSAKLADTPRTAHQIMQLDSELRSDPLLLAPPHARLLRVLARTVPTAEGLHGGTRFGLKASAINRLLDSFSSSPLVTWDTGEAAAGGVTPGGRLKLGDASLDIVPVSSGEGTDLRIMLAARWPDGKLRRLDEIVYVPSDDELHPSLVLADGAFWRVAEEPPAHVIRRLAHTGSMVVPKDGREHFLGLLASSFTSVADALASHMRVHRARPLVTLDLGADDWLHLRLFAHTGGPDWRPGADPSGAIAFELSSESEWVKLDAGTTGLDSAGERARLGQVGGESDALANAESDAAAAEEHAAGGTNGVGVKRGVAKLAAAAAESAAAAAASATANAEAEADAPPVWVEVPDPAPIEPVREWLALLPLSRRGKRIGVAGPAPVIHEEPVSDDAEPDDEPAEGTGDEADAIEAAAPKAPPEFGVWIRLGARTLNTFAEVWEQRPRHVTFLGNERMRTLLGERRAVRARVTVTSSGVDWFTVSAEWRAEGQALTDEELAKLRGSANRFVKLKSGWVSREWVEAYDAEAAMLADLGLEAGGGEQRLTLAQLAQARPESLAALDGLGEDARTLREIERLREQVKNFAGLPRIAVPDGLKATLRPYQHDGLDFLAFVTNLGMGAVLADDMGLGKTVQALAWIEWLRERDPKGGPVLVVCPASVVHNWQRESERFTPHLKVLVLASGEERHALRKEVPQHDLVITNYALLRRDIEYWKAIPLRAAILDEAQNIKNPKAAVSRAVLELNARHRMALTGTPIENRALDLWSIMQFVNPGHLGRRAEFVSRYDRPDAPAHARRLLAARLRPVMVRRLKEQVAPDLPDRIEERRECELTPGQRKLYLAELMRGRETVERLKSSPEGVMRNKIEVLALLTRLRQVCCHPTLAGGREDLGSGKFDALFEILEPLMAEGRKVLVFSQFVECLKLLAAEMKRREIRYHMLTGATTRREEVVTAFESDPDPCVFLISLKAGGTGLNLTSAQYVVLFDPWWNPAVEAQAIDRTHRIGQTRTVIAYRMLAAGTIEQKIWELQQRKEALASEVLAEDGFARTLTAGDLDYLLA